jgi:hypothetical protein
MRRRSSVTILLLSIGLALVGNLATDAVSIDAAWWPWAVWIMTGMLVAAGVILPCSGGVVVYRGR